MSLMLFYLITASMVLACVLLFVFPLIRATTGQQQATISNTALVKARLAEIDQEVLQGVLAADEKANAQNEIKLGLVAELQEHQQALKVTRQWPNIVGLLVALAVGLTVYINVNHIEGLVDKSKAPENLKQLSAKLLSPDANQSIQPQEIQQLALAIRLRLRETPDDAQGWMFLGRLRGSLGQMQEAITAYERSLELRPENRITRVSYAQALMMSGTEESLKRAKYEFSNLLANEPNNDNFKLMMSVTLAQLGELTSARDYYLQIRDKLDPNSAMRASLETQLASVLTTDTLNADNREGIALTIDVADELRASLPKAGFLVVFARAGDSQSGMPLAVKRQMLSPFPVQIRLTDENAMIPELTLSSIEMVTVTARVSASADVTAKTGDFEGSLIIDSSKGFSEYIVEINKEIQ